MTIFNIISSYGVWLVSLAIVENILMFLLIIDCVLYHLRYKKLDKIVKEIREDGRE